nr:PIN domain-containing protein [Myxococcus sp. MH1]
MFPAVFRVFIDANVFFSGATRDTLLRVASAGLIQPYWSDRVLEEFRRNLIAKRNRTPESIDRTLALLGVHFPDSKVTGYEHLESSMRNHLGDRHVAAAAFKAQAQVLVTNNLKHFQKEDLPDFMEAQSADGFLRNLFDLDSETLLQILRQHAEEKKKPPQTFEQHLNALSKPLPGFVQDVRDYLRLLDSDPDGSA